MNISMRRVRTVAAAVGIAAALAFSARTSVSRAEDVPMPKGGPQKVPAGTQPVDGAADLKTLDAKIKALRDEYHGKLDPLESQVKALRDQYDPQIAELQTQRKTVAEARKPPAIQDLDRREEADLLALGAKEKDELVSVRTKYLTERKAVEQKYDDQRKEALAQR